MSRSVSSALVRPTAKRTHRPVIGGALLDIQVTFLIFRLFLRPRKMSSNTHFRVILISPIASASFKMYEAADTRYSPLPPTFGMYHVVIAI